MTAVASMTGDYGSSTFDHIGVRPGLPDDLPCSAANDVSVELLRTIAGVLDVRAVFPRVSDIVRRVLPHDGLELLFQERAETFRVEARSTDTIPERHLCRVGEEVDAYIVSDLRGSAARFGRYDAPEYLQRLVTAGYRSLMSVRSLALNRAIRVVFYSTRPDAYRNDDRATAQ